ncbi:MAG: glutathione peroxidase [Ignavibacteriae bacterium]|nr:glutathione peroxidase [Ignavibacteriota bacterium]
MKNKTNKMTKRILLLLVITAFAVTSYACSKRTETTTKTSDPINVSDVKVKTMDGQEKSISDFKGKVLLIVNVASKCGYTPQYEGLEKIYEKYKDKGLEILAFPCNDFGGQEPGTNEEIQSFCKSTYNVTFPLFDKVKVLGGDKAPLYSKLIGYEPAGDISWNFEKFLIDKNGNVVGRYKSKVKPESDEFMAAIEKLL